MRVENADHSKWDPPNMTVGSEFDELRTSLFYLLASEFILEEEKFPLDIRSKVS